MSLQKELVESYATTSWLVTKFSGGLSHEDSLATPHFRTNSFNWVLGHILVSRDRALALVGKEPVLNAADSALYETGSEPVDFQTAVTLERLLKGMDDAQERLAEGLMAATEEDMAALCDEERNQTVGDRLKGLHWHETYHVGQLEVLRQVSGEREAFP